MTTDKIPIVDIKARVEAAGGPIREAIERVLRSGTFILGPEVQSLEHDIAALCGVRHAIGVSSGTDALLVAMMALGVGPGDEVVTTPMSFFASVGAIVRLGAKPVFADIDPRTFNLSPDGAAERIGPATRAVEVVHLFGQCAVTVPVVEAAARVGAAVIEDAAQAIGAARGGVPAGRLGRAACFSFFPTKNLGAFGDAGMVVTDDEQLADRMRVLRVHGARPKYHHGLVGGNMRLDAIQAAILSAMLPLLDGWNARRRANADRYDALLGQAGLVERELVTPPWRDPDCSHIFHHYVIRARDRDALRDHLGARGVGTEVYYPLPLHLQPCLKDLGHREGDFPEAERAAREVLALPVYPELTAAQQDRVVDGLVSFYK
jgi:dTDP-4-amino-4,6-dideoxygalactose transaminase